MAKVLIIDDDPIARAILEEALRSCGIEEFLFAENGRQAANCYLEQSDDVGLIITDLLMPDFDGIEFVSFLATFPNPCPIIICSSADPCLIRSASMLAGSLKLNLLGQLSKPVKVADLERMLFTAQPKHPSHTEHSHSQGA